MRILVKAIVTGFGLSLGSALYKKVSRRFRFLDEEDKKTDEEKVNQQDGVTDPALQQS